MVADKKTYLTEVVRELAKSWPENRTVNIVFHGHSIPAGYTANHVIRPFDAYPYRMHVALNRRFPCAVINCIVTAVGGEDSVGGAKRFAFDVLCHQPDLLVIDYACNDRFAISQEVEASWRYMIEQAIQHKLPVLLVTPLPDCGRDYWEPNTLINPMESIVNMIRQLASEYNVGLADATGTYERLIQFGMQASDLLLSVNHPNRNGHLLIVKELLQWFPL